MTQIIYSGANQGEFDFLLFSIVTRAFASPATSSLVTYTEGSLVLRLRGTFTSFDSNRDPTAGTITSIELTDHVGARFTFTGLSLAVQTVFPLVANLNEANVATLRNLLFGGADVITGDLSTQYILGYGGDDVIDGGGGSDILFGGSGNDRIIGNGSLYGEAGSDILIGGGFLNGGEGNDRLEGGAGNDELTGGVGVDTFFGGAGNDRVVDLGAGETADGGDGSDSYTYVMSETTRWLSIGRDLALQTGDGASARNFEQFFITGSLADDVVAVAYFEGFNIISDLTAGRDVFAIDLSWAQSYTLRNGGRWDIGSTTFEVTAADGTLSSLNVSAFEILHFTGGALSDWVTGGGDDDILIGGAGDDSLNGFSGDDVIDGGAGNDVLNGEDGIDTLSYASLTGGVGVAVSLQFQFGGIQQTGAGGNDTLREFENLTGSNFQDRLEGDHQNNVLAGLQGDDRIDALGGNDTINFSGVRSQYAVRTVQEAGRLVTHVIDQGGQDGADQLLNTELIQFQDGYFSLAGAQQNLLSAFDGGRFADVLYRNTSTNEVAFRDMTDSGAGGFYSLLAGAAQDYRVFASADVTGDGRAELFFQFLPTGAVGVFNSANGAWTAAASNITPAFEAIAVGDFTGDAVADILFRDGASGNVYFADVEAGGVFGSWGFVANLGDEWRTVGLGDFNRDGGSDVLFQHIATGLTYYRDVINGRWGFVSGAVGPEWRAKAAGDLNGDGFSDVVFQHATRGDVWYVNMLGGQNAGWGVVGSGLVGWDIGPLADLDNDGYADVVIQNQANGTTYFADMNAGAFAGWGVVSGAVGAEWALV